ncbi:pentatricopeptide repeat-containing protein At1g64583, mitochondrial-like [Rhododendron vialii]|uniref:pentatricopeptide repeat-containing protein At1g64583, mitochondrial-like n=1 Tax=Rhododendron vialii TaxID=182163 RepID=UPI00265E85D5|nr:pentatricopeptide repeat-containing protein At1g64583, mitochondrial-like [Rhododendron vialii]
MSPTLLASSLLHSSLPSHPPVTSHSFLAHDTTQQTKFIQFATIPTSTPNSSQTTSDQLSSPKEVISNPIYQIGFNSVSQDSRTSSKLQVQNLVKRITALPTSHKSRIIDTFQSDGGFNTISDFNDLLMAFVEADELEIALKLMSSDISSSHGLFPNSWTYSIMIKLHCKKNHLSEAKRVLDHMLENGFQPNAATFTDLISAFCRGGRVGKALEVIGIMRGIGIELTIRTYNCLLKGLCYVGKVEKAYELLMNIKKSSKKKPDIYTYTVVMDGFCKVGRSDEAYELLVEALEVSLTPNVVTYNTLFNGYWKEGRPLEGMNVLKQMKDRGCVPDYISYNTLLFGLLKWAEIRAAVRIYKEMVGIGYRVDERVMNNLLRRLCRGSRREGGLLKDAYEVFERMADWEFVVYDFTYDLVIEAYCRGRDADLALVNLHRMVGLGYDPKIVTFNNVVRALCVEGKVEEALSVVVMYRGRGFPSRATVDILIDELNRRLRHSETCRLLAAGLKLGLIPNREARGKNPYSHSKQVTLHNVS